MRTGRPRLADGTRKASTFSVRLTAEERGVVELSAERAGVKASEWARHSVRLSHTQKEVQTASGARRFRIR